MAKSTLMAKRQARSIGEEAVSEDYRSQWLTGRVVPHSYESMCSDYLVEVGVSLHSYSGVGDPPNYKDSKMQRHWMKITTNLPTNKWYRNSSVNDLRYWGSVYRPFAFYQSYVHILWLKPVLLDSIKLFTLRGYES